MSGYSTYLNDDLNSQMDQVNDPGVSVSVLFEGQTRIRNMKGVRELSDDHTLVSSTDKHYLASVTKPMTAEIVLQLAASGSFNLSDRISAHLEHLPGYMNEITVDHLLNHTSGIPDYYEYLDWAAPQIDNEYVLQLLTDNVDSLAFRPGSEFGYSNANYILLAMLIEKVTQQSYAHVMEQEIFDKYNMRHAHVSFDERRGNYATGYRWVNNRYLLNDFSRIEFENGFIAPFNKKTYGSSGAFATVPDMESWVLHLGASDYFKTLKGTAVAIEDRSFEFATNVKYKAGWYFGIVQGEEVYWHSGGFAGYRNMVVVVPDKQFGIVALSSNGKFDAEHSGLEWVNEFLAGAKRQGEPQKT